MPGFLNTPDINNNPQEIAHLIGQTLQQFGCVADADGLAVICFADDQCAAIGIGKATYPLQVFVTPALKAGTRVFTHFLAVTQPKLLTLSIQA